MGELWEVGKAVFVWFCLGPAVVVMLVVVGVAGLAHFLNEISE